MTYLLITFIIIAHIQQGISYILCPFVIHIIVDLISKAKKFKKVFDVICRM